MIEMIFNNLTEIIIFDFGVTVIFFIMGYYLGKQTIKTLKALQKSEGGD